MKISNFILILFFPLFVFADGIKISHYTLEAINMAVLVKVLLYDVKRNAAKVEILKKFTRTGKDENSSTGGTVVYGRDVESKDSEPFADETQLKVGQTALLRMRAQVKMVPRKWVSEVKYWNSVGSQETGSKSILIFHEGHFEFTPYSKDNENKIEVLFDPIKAEKKISTSNLAELKLLLLDQDFESLVLNELLKRKAFNGTFVASISDRGDQFRVVTRFSNMLSDAERESFWMEYADVAAKGKLEGQKQFLQQFYYYSQIKSIDTRIKIYEKFSQEDSDLRSQIHMFMRESRELNKNNNQKEILTKIKKLFLENLKSSPNNLPDLSIADFFSDLPVDEKADFLVKVTDLYLEHGKKNGDMGPFEPLILELASSESLKLAWTLTEVPLTESNRKEKLFNTILKVIFAKENLTDPKVKTKILKYIETYGNEARYPIEMTPEVKVKYNEIGGVRYDDMDMLRLVHQNNSDELATYFSRYYEKALTVEVLETETKNNKSTIKLKIEKNSGEFKTSGTSSYGYKVVSICKNAVPGKTLLLSIDKESLETLISTKLKRMILATRSDDYKFVILDTKYDSQIESSIKNGIK